MVWTYFKNMPSLLFWKGLPQHLLANIVTLIRFSLTGQASVIFRAKWDALLGLGKAIEQRELIQKNIKILPDDLRKVIAEDWLSPYFKSKKLM
jgi:hypothetical protein